MESRRSKVEEKRKARSAFLLILSSVVLLAFLMFIGVGNAAKLALYLGNFRHQTAQGEDKTPPGPPRIDAQTPFVTDPKYTIVGYSEAGSTLHLYLNDKEINTIKVGDDSKFSSDITMEKGENVIYAVATDEAGNNSEKSSNIKITYDPDPPVIEVTNPQDSTEVYSKALTITGKTEPGASISAGDVVGIVNEDGSFTLKYQLTEGDNIIDLTSIDQAGNKGEKTLTVKYTP